MPVETATYISDLVPANPLVTDGLNQGDDHLRLIKQVLQTTFPHASGAVSAAFADLDHGYVPVGGIVLWSGSIASIPANWHLCDGTSGTPDLRDRFVVGAGSTYAVDATGGSATTSSDGAHTHTGATGGTALSLDMIPAQGNVSGTPGTGDVVLKDATEATHVNPHTHTISSDGAHTHTHTPPYFALAYIQRIT